MEYQNQKLTTQTNLRSSVSFTDGIMQEQFSLNYLHITNSIHYYPSLLQ